jgi:hypothetical protein
VRRPLGDASRASAGGVLILTVPLVFPVNPEPEDFWRFTGGAVDRLLRDAGFDRSEDRAARRPMVFRGLPPGTVPSPAPHRDAGRLRVAMALDRRTERRLPGMAPNPVGYCARAVA